jgi:hypothetical protein
MANRSSKERLIDYYVTRQATHIALYSSTEGRVAASKQQEYKPPHTACQTALAKHTTNSKNSKTRGGALDDAREGGYHVYG